MSHEIDCHNCEGCEKEYFQKGFLEAMEMITRWCDADYHKRPLWFKTIVKRALDISENQLKLIQADNN